MHILELDRPAADKSALVGESFAVGTRNRAGEILAAVRWGDAEGLKVSLHRDVRVPGRRLECRFAGHRAIEGVVHSAPLLPAPKPADVADRLTVEASTAFAADDDEARALAELADQYNVVTQEGNNHGYNVRTVEMIRAGTIGDVREVHLSGKGGSGPRPLPTGTPDVPNGEIVFMGHDGPCLLGIDGLDRDTEMRVDDEEAGKSIGRYVREVLLVSDNVAFNRLYDFVGQEPLNRSLQKKGLEGTRIMHRLEIAMSVEDNRRTGPVRFVDGDTVVFEQDAAYSATDYTAPEPIPLGKAEIVGGERLERPKDFATKNAYPIRAQHDVIKALMFPDAVAEHMRFDLTNDDYAFLYRNMSGYPGESGIPEYGDADRYPEGYVKFFMYGGDAPDVPDNIRIFNKVGDAYGFLTDAAYIVDFDNGVEFILAATIFTNANQTFNDDTYEYDEIALPFMRDLGKAIYEIELQRERPHRPDLGRFRVARD